MSAIPLKSDISKFLTWGEFRTLVQFYYRTKADVKYIIDLSKKFKSHFVKINSPFFSIK